MLKQSADYITFDLLGLIPGTRPGEALNFFLYDTAKIFLLLTTIIYAVAIIRTSFPPEKTKQILSHKREYVGNVLAALLGVVTPFCSCSAVPLFIGFVEPGVPLYSNAAGVIPIVHALMEKGMAIGTVLAFMMAVTALSLPEAIILKNVLKNRLLVVFFGIVAPAIVCVGYLFNTIL